MKELDRRFPVEVMTRGYHTSKDISATVLDKELQCHSNPVNVFIVHARGNNERWNNCRPCSEDLFLLSSYLQKWGSFVRCALVERAMISRTVDCTCGSTLHIAYCVLHTVYCMARQYGNYYQFSQWQNTRGSKRRLNSPFPWQSVKLFTTKCVLNGRSHFCTRRRCTPVHVSAGCNVVKPSQQWRPQIVLPGAMDRHPVRCYAINC